MRRTAEIVFGEPDSDEYLDLKNYEVNPHQCNLSVGLLTIQSMREVGMDYRPSAERVCVLTVNPATHGFKNMKKYGRMADEPNWKDKPSDVVEIHVWNKLLSPTNCVVLWKHFPTNHDSIRRLPQYAQVCVSICKNGHFGTDPLARNKPSNVA